VARAQQFADARVHETLPAPVPCKPLGGLGRAVSGRPGREPLAVEAGQGRRPSQCHRLLQEGLGPRSVQRAADAASRQQTPGPRPGPHDHERQERAVYERLGAGRAAGHGHRARHIGGRASRHRCVLRKSHEMCVVAGSLTLPQLVAMSEHLRYTKLIGSTLAAVMSCKEEARVQDLMGEKGVDFMALLAEANHIEEGVQAFNKDNALEFLA